MGSALRWLALGGVLALIVLMVGPFQGAEKGLGLTDKVAHAMAFALITAAIFINWLSASRAQVAGSAVLLGAFIEVIQSLSGRDAEFGDVLADAVGVAVVSALWIGRRLV